MTRSRQHVYDPCDLHASSTVHTYCQFNATVKVLQRPAGDRS